MAVIVRDKPEQSLFGSYLRLHPDFRIKGHLGARDLAKRHFGPDLEIGREQGGEIYEPLEVYGPYRVFEAEDIEPEVAEAVPPPCWQIEVGCSLSSEET